MAPAPPSRNPKGGALLAKGTIFVNVRGFVTGRFGGEAWAHVVAALPEDARLAIQDAVAIGWYETRHQPLLYATMDRVLGNADLSLVDDLARYSADVDLGGIYRLLLPVLEPGTVLARGMSYWSRFQNSGTWEVARTSPTRASAVLTGFDVAEPALCRYLRGYMRRMLEIAGARAVRIDHVRCRARGDQECRFEGTWMK